LAARASAGAVQRFGVARFLVLMGLSVPLALAAAGTAHAQQADDAPVVTPENQVDFAADRLEYANDADIVTAIGNVRMTNEGNSVRADRIVWNRVSGEVRATGNVVAINPGGDTLYGDNVELTDTLKDGVIGNLLLVLADGGRLAAVRATRVDGITTLERAAYSPCPVTDENGCPKKPSWQIAAVRIVHDPVRKRLTFKRAKLELFGLPIAVLPTFSTSLGEEGQSGVLFPDFQYTRANGFEIAVPFYTKISNNRDLTVTPHIYTAVLPAIEAQYRALTGNGAYQVTGFATYGSRLDINSTTARRSFRGYIDASGRFQIDPEWSISGSIRRVTDRTFLRRYDLSYDDRLRSIVNVERIDPQSYFSLQGITVQTLRANDVQGQIPIALPAVDYRRRLADPLAGGTIELQLNALALGRTTGQDTQRAFAAARWDVRRLTDWGQELLLTAYARGDLYHSDENLKTATALYRGVGGFQARGVAALAAELRWPFIGSLFGGTQRLTPRLQFVATPATRNLDIPNEDARSIDLEDSNLFALNRFPGYDRWEDSSRVTYGVDWAYDSPGISVSATIGQSYRINSRASIFPDGTGLNSRLSDVVGRATIKYRRFLSLTQRFRLDKDNLAVRRSEIDATIGSDSTYATIGYLRLNRNIGPQLEDLRDREEIRLGGRVQITRFISIFGSTTIDLTDASEDPTNSADGYQPVRHRLGIAYTDDCLDIGFTWRRDYDSAGDARRGNSFLLRLAFRGLGR
jgi:LPS-assembly protein